MLEQALETGESKQDADKISFERPSSNRNRKRKILSKRIEANRKNATRSTGPKTVEGRNIVKLNPIKHGLLSKEVLLSGEDEADFAGFRDGLWETWKPVGEQESFLVNQMADLAWRIRRGRRIEAGILASVYYGILVDRAKIKARRCQETSLDRMLAEKIQGKITDEGKYKKYLSEGEKAEAQAELQGATLGEAFIKDAANGDALSKLSRYETALERSFYRALHELQRLQAARAGQPVPVPLVADVNFSIVGADAGPTRKAVEDRSAESISASPPPTIDL